MLSGFILVYTYSGPPLNVRRFWKARFARIYPAYILSLIAASPFFFFAIRGLDLPFFTWSKQHLALACILTIGLLQAWVPQAALTWNSVCWSLSVESFFYLLFPMLLPVSKKLSERKLILWIACFWLVSLSFSLAYIVAHPDGADKINSPETNLFWKNVLSFNPLVRLPEFVIGMLTCRLYLAGRVARRQAAPLVLAGLLAVVIVTAFARQIPIPVISTGLLSLAFAAVICGIALQPAWTSILEARWLLLLGNASYSLYLLHSVVMASAFDAIPHWPWWTRVAASLAAAIGASLIAYRFVEEPARGLLRPAPGCQR